jgi:hypothetical protein
MATLCNDGNINWNGSWQTTGQVKTLHASTNISVTNASAGLTAPWQGNSANTDRGVLIYFNSATAGADRTITANLQKSVNADGTGGFVTQVSGTFNLVQSATKTLSWIYLKYSSTHTETTGTGNNYQIQITNSIATATAFRADNSATTKVAFIQVLDATATMADNDVAFIVGQSTQTSGNPDTATVNYNVETGAGTTGDNGHPVGNVTICNAGVLTALSTSSKNWYFEIAGDRDIQNGGTWNFGTTGTTIHATSTFTIEDNSTSAARITNIRIGGKYSIQGAPFTGNLWRTTTTTAVDAVGTRTIQLADNVSAAGWVGPNDIIISTTSTTAGQTEEKIISSVGTSPNSLTITTDWTNTHLSGAEVCNLTRNVRYIGSGTNGSSIVSASTVIDDVNFDWIRFSDLYVTVSTYFVITSGSSSFYSLDYCVFDTITPNTTSNAIVGFTNAQLTQLSFTFSNLCFWFNNILAVGLSLSSTISGTTGAAQSIPRINITYSTFAKNSTLVSPMAYNSGNTMVKYLNCNFYDYGSGTLTGYAMANNPGSLVKLYNCKFWGLRGGFSSAESTNSGNTPIGGYVNCKIKNCIFGGDGTNTVANAIGDIFFGNSLGIIESYNSKFLSTPDMTMPSGYGGDPQEKYVSSHDHNQVQYRYKTWQVYGIISDQITGGYTAAYARGGSGLCVCLNPGSSTAGNSLNWEFYIPVTAATGTTLKFYITRTTAFTAGTVNVDIYDSNDDLTLKLDNESVPLASIPLNDGVGDDWTYQYTSSSFSPTDTGFCRVVVKVVDGSTTGDILIDDVSTS